MKSLNQFLSEKAVPIDTVQDIQDPSPTDGKRKVLKVKNKVVINPDYGSYQGRTHKDSDTSVPLDNINTNGKTTIQSTSTGTNY